MKNLETQAAAASKASLTSAEAKTRVADQGKAKDDNDLISVRKKDEKCICEICTCG